MTPNIDLLFDLCFFFRCHFSLSFLSHLHSIHRERKWICCKPAAAIISLNLRSAGAFSMRPVLIVLNQIKNKNSFNEFSNVKRRYFNSFLIVFIYAGRVRCNGHLKSTNWQWDPNILVPVKTFWISHNLIQDGSNRQQPAWQNQSSSRFSHFASQLFWLQMICCRSMRASRPLHPALLHVIHLRWNCLYI